MSTKEWAGLFKFCLDLELYAKKLKRLGFCALFFYIFITKSRSRQNKKNPKHPFVDIINWLAARGHDVGFAINSVKPRPWLCNIASENFKYVLNGTSFP